MKNYVTGFMFSKDMKKVLLINKLSPDWQKGKFNGLGGKVEENESFAASMVREFYEECGVKTNTSNWHEVLNIICPSKYKVVFFYSYSDEIFNSKSHEKEEVKIFDVDNLPENVIYNLNWIIPLCLDDKLDRTFTIPVLEKEL